MNCLQNGNLFSVIYLDKRTDSFMHSESISYLIIILKAEWKDWSTFVFFVMHAY